MARTWYIKDNDEKIKAIVEFSNETNNLSKIDIWEELDKDDMKKLGKFLIAQSKI